MVYKWVVNRWIKRKIIDVDDYNIEDIISLMIKENYESLGIRDKRCFGLYFRHKLPLVNFNWNTCHSLMISVEKKCGHDSKFAQWVKDSKKMKELTILQREGRIKKSGSIHASYKNAIIKKGKRKAWDLGIFEELPDSEYSKLSGFTKKMNYCLKSAEEKIRYVIEWKRSNLRNNNIIDILCKEYPEFISCSLNSDSDVNKWYSTYVSITSAMRIVRGGTKKGIRGICGFFDTFKNNHPLYYRSSWEKRVLEFLENINDVSYIDTEPYHIKYKREKETFDRAYVPDILFILRGKTYLIEVKPEYLYEQFFNEKLRYLTEEIIIVTENEIEDMGAFYEHLKKYIKD